MIIMGNPLFSIFGEDGKSCILGKDAGNVVVGAGLRARPFIFLPVTFPHFSIPAPISLFTLPGKNDFPFTHGSSIEKCMVSSS